MAVCPNLGDPNIAEQFNELVDSVGERAAYALWNKNKGYPLDFNPKGEKSNLFEELKKVTGDRNNAIYHKSRIYTNSFLSKMDWLSDNIEPTLNFIGDAASYLAKNGKVVFFSLTKAYKVGRKKNKTRLDGLKNTFETVTGKPITVKEVDDLVEDGKIISDGEGITILINKETHTSETLPHEFGHLYLETLGYRNEHIQYAIKKLEGTQLYEDVSKTYPDLNKERLDKEVLATAIGQEYDKLSKQSWFKIWFNKLTRLVGKALGISKESAKTLALDMFSLNIRQPKMLNLPKFEEASRKLQKLEVKARKALKDIPPFSKEDSNVLKSTLRSMTGDYRDNVISFINSNINEIRFFESRIKNSVPFTTKELRSLGQFIKMFDILESIYAEIDTVVKESSTTASQQRDFKRAKAALKDILGAKVEIMEYYKEESARAVADAIHPVASGPIIAGADEIIESTYENILKEIFVSSNDITWGQKVLGVLDNSRDKVLKLLGKLVDQKKSDAEMNTLKARNEVAYLLEKLKAEGVKLDKAFYDAMLETDEDGNYLGYFVSEVKSEYWDTYSKLKKDYSSARNNNEPDWKDKKKALDEFIDKYVSREYVDEVYEVDKILERLPQKYKDYMEALNEELDKIHNKYGPDSRKDNSLITDEDDRTRLKTLLFKRLAIGNKIHSDSKLGTVGEQKTGEDLEAALIYDEYRNKREEYYEKIDYDYEAYNRAMERAKANGTLDLFHALNTVQNKPTTEFYDYLQWVREKIVSAKEEDKEKFLNELDSPLKSDFQEYLDKNADQYEQIEQRREKIFELKSLLPDNNPNADADAKEVTSKILQLENEIKDIQESLYGTRYRYADTISEYLPKTTEASYNSFLRNKFFAPIQDEIDAINKAKSEILADYADGTNLVNISNIPTQQLKELKALDLQSSKLRNDFILNNEQVSQILELLELKGNQIDADSTENDQINQLYESDPLIKELFELQENISQEGARYLSLRMKSSANTSKSANANAKQQFEEALKAVEQSGDVDKLNEFLGNFGYRDFSTDFKDEILNTFYGKLTTEDRESVKRNLSLSYGKSEPTTSQSISSAVDFLKKANNDILLEQYGILSSTGEIKSSLLKDKNHLFGVYNKLNPNNRAKNIFDDKISDLANLLEENLINFKNEKPKSPSNFLYYGGAIPSELENFRIKNQQESFRDKITDFIKTKVNLQLDNAFLTNLDNIINKGEYSEDIVDQYTLFKQLYSKHITSIGNIDANDVLQAFNDLTKAVAQESANEVLDRRDTLVIFLRGNTSHDKRGTLIPSSDNLILLPKNTKNVTYSPNYKFSDTTVKDAYKLDNEKDPENNSSRIYSQKSRLSDTITTIHYKRAYEEYSKKSESEFNQWFNDNHTYDYSKGRFKPISIWTKTIATEEESLLAGFGGPNKKIKLQDPPQPKGTWADYKVKDDPSLRNDDFDKNDEQYNLTGMAKPRKGSNYYNSKYNDLMQNSAHKRLYTLLMDLYFDRQSKLKYHNRRGYKLMNVGKRANWKLDVTRDPDADKKNHKSGIKRLPVYYTDDMKNKEGEEDWSNFEWDLARSVMMFVEKTDRYEQLEGILTELQLASELFQDRKAIKRDSKGNAIKSSKFEDDPMIPEEDKYETVPADGAKERYETFLAMHVYDEGQDDMGEILGVDINKMLSTLKKYNSFRVMSINFRSAVSNVAYGESMQIMEAMAGQYFNKKIYGKASKMYMEELPSILGDIGGRNYKSKVNRINEALNTFGNFDEVLRLDKMSKQNDFQRLMNTDTLFFTNNAGEHAMQSRLAVAILMQYRLEEDRLVKIKEGESSIYDNLLFDEKGNIVITDDEGNHLSEEDVKKTVAKAKAKLRGIVFLVHGNYSKDHKVALQKKALGDIAMQFRKWLYQGWVKRWAKLDYLEDLEEMQEGYYATFGKFAKQFLKDIRKHKMYFISQGEVMKGLRDENLTGWEKEVAEVRLANLKRLLTEASYLMAATIIGTVLKMILSNLDEDELLHDILSFFDFVNARFMSEMQFYYNIIEASKILRAPAASFNMLEEGGEFLLKLATPWNYGDVYQRGKRKGDLKIMKEFRDLIPIYTKIEQLYYISEDNKQLNKSVFESLLE